MIIGLVGFIGSGKGTVGDILEQRGFEKDSFARPLKDACASIFGWPRAYLEGDSEVSRKWREDPDKFWSEKFGFSFSPRTALQWMGTEAGRNVFHPDIWVISLLNRSAGKNVVVTDVRFRNEVDHIQKSGGLVVRVIRGSDPPWFDHLCLLKDPEERELFMSKRGVHSSEWDWVGVHFDHIIRNDGSLQDLGKSVNTLLKKIETECII
jgi:hypothetical protein